MKLIFFLIFLPINTLAGIKHNMCLSEMRRSNDNYGLSKSTSFQTVKRNLPTKEGVFYFEIHFPGEKKFLAKKIEKIIEKDGRRVIEYFGTLPQNTTHFIIDDVVGMANGGATVFPTNIIYLNNYPPIANSYLASSNDWWRILVIHELVHILTLEKIDGGFAGFMEKVFGSVGNLISSVVPRWYAEGIAVWAETYFTNEGRLRNKRLLKEVMNALGDNKFCKGIGCLDDPLQYPFGSAAYWVGGDFLAFVENKYPGALKCIVREKGSTLYLSSAFIKCTGEYTQNLYFEYYDQKIEKIQESEDKDFKVQGQIDWQKNIVVKKQKAYMVTNYNEKRFITQLDLKTGKEQKKLLPKFIENLQDPDPNNGQTDVILTYRDLTLNNNYANQIHAAYLDNFLRIKDLGMANYVFQTRRSETLAHFEDDFWSFVAPEAYLPRYMDFSSPHLMRQKNKKEKIFFVHQGKLKAYVVQDRHYEEHISSNESMRIVGICRNRVYLEHGKYFGLYNTLNFNYKKYFLKDDDFPLNKNINATIYQTGRSRIKVISEDCSDFELRLKKTSQTVSVQKMKIKSKKIHSPKIKSYNALGLYSSSEIESFPSLRHFRPYYWFLNAGNSSNIFNASVLTNLADSYMRHVIDAEIISYPAINKITPNISYSYSQKNNYQISFLHNKYFAKKAISKNLVSNGVTGFFLAKDFGISNFIIRPSLYFQKIKEDDFISNRKVTRKGGRLSWIYTSLQEGHFLRGLRFNLEGYLEEPLEDGFAHSESFWGIVSNLKSSFELKRDFLFRGNLSYGKVYNDNQINGVLKGGGNSEISPFEFYGLGYTDIYGSSITAARAQFEKTIKYFYDDSGFSAFYPKEFKALLGYDFIRANVIEVDGKVLQNNSLSSVHGGGAFSLNLLYRFPLEVQLLYAKILEESIGETIINIKASSFF